jgi:hypothetical protein
LWSGLGSNGAVRAVVGSLTGAAAHLSGSLGVRRAPVQARVAAALSTKIRLPSKTIEGRLRIEKIVREMIGSPALQEPR